MGTGVAVGTGVWVAVGDGVKVGVAEEVGVLVTGRNGVRVANGAVAVKLADGEAFTLLFSSDPSLPPGIPAHARASGSTGEQAAATHTAISKITLLCEMRRKLAGDCLDNASSPGGFLPQGCQNICRDGFAAHLF